MKRPPLLLRMKIRGEKRMIGCWLPLFLLLPLVLALLIVLSPLILIAAIVLWRSGRRRQQLSTARTILGILCSPRGVRGTLDLLCSTPGLLFDVSDSEKRVHISLI